MAKVIYIKDVLERRRQEQEAAAKQKQEEAQAELRAAMRKVMQMSAEVLNGSHA